jgi:uncharacterized protein YbaP (TraB family)
MRMRSAAVLFCALLSGPGFGQEPVPENASSPAAVLEEAPERIVITGQRPGPGLWKVSKGEHVMWIFGTYGPLPKDLVWQSKEVESLLAQSQELIHPPSSTYQPGFFTIVRLLPHLIGVKNNPDGAKLREKVSPEAYERWLLLKQQYIGKDDDVESWRPYFAAQLLYRKGLERIGLSGGGQPMEKIVSLAKQHKLKITRPGVPLTVDSPAAALKQFKKTPLEDAACFAATLQRLGSDIELMRERANAWAKGDLKAMEKVGYADREDACGRVMLNASGFKDVVEGQSIEQRMDAAWMDAVDTALTNNRSTFALLRVNALLRADGLLARLEARGYKVERPE